MGTHDNARTDAGDIPRRIRDCDVAERYGISRRLGGEWLRAAVAAGVLRKAKRVTVGRWSALDTYVANGGQVEKRGRR
jgi:hypothetical protein